MFLMPRKSLFNVNLSNEERQALESMTRKYASPYCVVILAKIILLANGGLSNNVIASRLDTPSQIVSKWRKRFALARLPGLEVQPRGGRKATLEVLINSLKSANWRGLMCARLLQRQNPAAFVALPSIQDHVPGRQRILASSSVGMAKQHLFSLCTKLTSEKPARSC
jgi:hypothetical protein